MLWMMFGWKIALTYIASGVFVAIFAGMVLGRMNLEHLLEDYVYRVGSLQCASITDNQMVAFTPSCESDETGTSQCGCVEINAPQCACAADEPKLTWKDRASYAKSYMLQILKKVWLWVMVGIAVGAVMHGYAPADFLAKYAGPHNPLAVPLAVIIGIPLYSNAAGMIPIVKELVRTGMAMGTALSLMMAVTALSLPEAIILRQVLKPKLLATYFGIVGLAIICIGYLFNIIL